MTLPASINIETKFNLAASPFKFNLALITNFVSESIDTNNVKANFKIVDPYNSTVYDNTSLVSPDLFGVGVTSITRSGSLVTVTTSASHGLTTGEYASISGAVEADYNGIHSVVVVNSLTFTYTISTTPATPATGTIKCLKASMNKVVMPVDLATGFPVAGTYKITITTTVSGAVQPGTYVKEFTYAYSYARPVVSIEQLLSVFLPRITSKDNTTYAQNGVAPSVQRTHKIDYPPESGLSPSQSSAEVVLINPPDVWNGIYITTINSILTYTMPDGLIVYDVVYASRPKEFLADPDLCCINSCLNELNDRYKAASGVNNTLATDYYNQLQRSLQLYNLYTYNIQCGNNSEAETNLADIYTVTNSNGGCCTKPTGQILPYNGYVGKTILEFSQGIPNFTGEYINYNNSLYKVLENTLNTDNPTVSPSKYQVIGS